MTPRMTYDEAVALLPGGDSIHTLFDGGFALISEDWDRPRVLALLAATRRREATPGPDHGLAAYMPVTGHHILIETRPAAAVIRDSRRRRQRGCRPVHVRAGLPGGAA